MTSIPTSCVSTSKRPPVGSCCGRFPTSFITNIDYLTEQQQTWFLNNLLIVWVNSWHILAVNSGDQKKRWPPTLVQFESVLPSLSSQHLIPSFFSCWFLICATDGSPVSHLTHHWSNITEMAAFNTQDSITCNVSLSTWRNHILSKKKIFSYKINSFWHTSELSSPNIILD